MIDREIKHSNDKIHTTSRKSRTRFDSTSKLGITFFLLLSGLVVAVHQIDFRIAADYGMYIPDSIGITDTFQRMHAANSWNHEHLTGLRGVALLYGWTWLIHPAFCYVVNLALMVASIALFRRIIITRLGAPMWSTLGLVGNPYLILVMPGPNKEIPLVLLTLLLCDALLRAKPQWLIAAAISTIVCFFRDGYGLILLLLTILSRALAGHQRAIPLVAFAIGGIAAVAWSPLASLVPAMARNLDIYLALSKDHETVGSIARGLALDPLHPIGGLLLYGLRLAYNLVSLAFFPVLETADKRIFVAGLSYWIYGVMCLTAWIGCGIVTLSLSERPSLHRLAASISLSVWFFISLSLFVQPRYLMPMLPIAFTAMAALPKKHRIVSILLAIGLVLSVFTIYAALGKFPTPTSTDSSLPTPAYVFR